MQYQSQWAEVRRQQGRLLLGATGNYLFPFFFRLLPRLMALSLHQGGSLAFSLQHLSLSHRFPPPCASPLSRKDLCDHTGLAE